MRYACPSLKIKEAPPWTHEKDMEAQDAYVIRSN